MTYTLFNEGELALAVEGPTTHLIGPKSIGQFLAIDFERWQRLNTDGTFGEIVEQLIKRP